MVEERWYTEKSKLDFEVLQVWSEFLQHILVGHSPVFNYCLVEDNGKADDREIHLESIGGF